jgi:phospholipase/carboxylesterase
MQSEINSDIQNFRDWVFRYRPALSTPKHLLILLHGWTGNENSMWLFANNISEDFAIIAPRARFPAPEGGYSWREITPGTWGYPSIDDLQPAVESFLEFIDEWSGKVNLSSIELDLVGFSQGGALSYTIAALHPDRIHTFAVLSGFLPFGTEMNLKPHLLDGKSAYVAHGKQDELVPVEKAHLAVEALERAGVKVTYCETEGGHKVSKKCRAGLTAFLQTHSYN